MKKQAKFSLIMLIVSAISLLSAFFAFIFVRSNNGANISSLFDNSISSFGSGWYNQYGLNFDVSTLSSRDLKFDSETPLYLSKTVPEISGKSAMFFRTNNLVVNVYLDGECVFFASENGYYNDLPSFSSYCYVPFNQADAGKEIMLEIYKTPVSFGFCIDSFIYGASENVVYKLKSDDSSVVISAVLTIITGFVFMWMGIISRKTFNHYRGLLFFGAFSFLIGVWFLGDTLWLYDAMKNITVVEFYSFVFLTAAVPCFMMYIYDFFNISNKKFYCGLVIAGFVLFLLSLLLNLSGVVPYCYTRYAEHIYIIVCGITLLAEMISYLAKINGNKGESKIFNLGVIFFVAFSLFDLGRFYQGNGGDSSHTTRLGIFILIVTVIAATTEDVVELFELGIKAGKIGKIAFTDANTGLGNPAAFKSKFEELDRTKGNYTYIGIIQFDVNNLKIINDSLGHEAGDLLIKTAAEIIEENFGNIGNCYRVGGDEFVTITTYNHAPLVCEEAIMKFENSIARFNNNSEKPFDLHIAYGVAYYQNNSHQFQSLKEVHKLADQRMYNKKKELKARYAKTPEEAVIR